MSPQANEEGVITAPPETDEKMTATAESAVQTTEGDEEEAKPTCRQRMIKFYWENEFVILVVIVILLARAYPPLGATYLAPEITATWIAVIFIFGTLSWFGYVV